ncbi:M28 family peptidase [candidate division KSB1 bacterium]|nr:M28 family peptidase [candidate division KSB1 bacterium]
MKALLALYVLLLALTATTHAQTTPFLTDDEIRMLQNEISGDRSFEHIRWLTHWHRDSGMEGYFKAAEYVIQAAKDAGLEDVKFVEQVLDGHNYTAKSAELWMLEPVEVKLADIGEHNVYLADGSHDAEVTAELIWIGDASKAVLDSLDVKGKIVLTDASPGRAAQNAVWDKGAVGIIAYPISENKTLMDYPDQIAWTRIPIEPPKDKQGTFAFTLSPRKGETLRKVLATQSEQDFFATGKRTKGGRVVVKAKVDTEIGPKPGRTGFVEGWIRGTKYHDQQIVITAHLQEEKGSANDDGSGCGNILELARAFNKLIAEGKMKRPLRDIRFWWTDEIYSEYRYFRDFPNEPKKMLANLHQDMSGAKQSMGNRVQHLIFAPHSRTSYLDAMFESLGTFLIQTNNAYLAAGRQGGLPHPFSRPLYSSMGTRDNYNAAFVPYFDSSDHMCFVEGAIGVPAVALINWPDDYIHSSDDDLDNIDPTQLRRNNFLIAAMAYVLAFAEDDDVPLFATETFAQSNRRLAKDLTVAMQLMKPATNGSTNEAWKDASLLIEQGILRERRAVQSARVFAKDNRNAQQWLETFVAKLSDKEKELRADLNAYYALQYNSVPQTIKLSPEELAASKKVPMNAMPLETYFKQRGEVRFNSKLHGLMRDEVYYFVDGKRSYYDIYKAVRAEALAAGSWYYGEVRLEDVVGLLDAAVEKGALVVN